jgi:predicted lipoprotein with Yx(FWY)xxD motif
MSSPPPGTVYFTVQKSSAGYILAESGKPVYEYLKDTAGKAGTCTGACATAWPPVMAQNPQVSPADNIPGTLGEVNGQATYNGHPLYTYAGGKVLTVHPGGEWKLVAMSKSDIKTG